MGRDGSEALRRKRAQEKEHMTDDQQVERRKLAAARGWLADPPPAPQHWPTLEERAARAEAGRRRYAPLATQRDNWAAFLRRYEGKG